MENTMQNKVLKKIKEVWNKDRLSPTSRNHFGVGCLCFATFTSILALGFFVTAFATDHWKHISVNRIKLDYLIKKCNDPMDERFGFVNEHKYYDRVEGLFQVCFPNAEKPDGIPQNIFGKSCVFKSFGWDYGRKPNFEQLSTGQEWTAMNLLTIITFGFYFVFMGVALVMGMIGCVLYKPPLYNSCGGVSKPEYSKPKYRCTSILMGIAIVPALLGMGFFHATNFYERNMVSFFPSEFIFRLCQPWQCSLWLWDLISVSVKQPCNVF